MLTPAVDDAFIERAKKNPGGMEDNVLRAAHEDAATQVQQTVRAMLQLMMDKVPGQLFRDIELFHKKFGLDPTPGPGHRLQEDILRFRIRFMEEELREYCEAVDMSLDTYLSGGNGFDPEKAFDALIDLVYVALGTAYLHRFPFNAGWERVNKANMAKVRASGDDDHRSVRKSSHDIVKPEGWVPPSHTDLLDPEPEATLPSEHGETIG